MAAILNRMVGKNGTVTIIKPHNDVSKHTEGRLSIRRSSGIIRVLRPQDIESSDENSKRFGRILITGSVREIPETIERMVVDGGFVLGPFGGPVHQRLLKKEKQGELWFDTDLGGVVFGPMDVGESESSPLDPDSLANHIEDAFDLVGGLVEIEEVTSERVLALVRALRDLPTDLPFIDEESTEEEIMEHPVVDLIMSEIDWLGPLWPIFSEFLSIDIASPGSSEEMPDFLGGHEDLVP